MNNSQNKTKISRIKELGGRDATVLENGNCRVIIDDQGSMVPELSLAANKGRLNAHWLPWFRSNSGKPFRDEDDLAFWKAKLLYHVAGNFPCIPNFGPGHIIDGIDMPPHGWTANSLWQFISKGTDEETGAVWAFSSLESPEKVMPLLFKKLDVLLPEQNIHYISIQVINTGSRDLEINAGWHNTLGAPFLAEGCRINAAADAWATAPSGSEFDTTTRLALDIEFSSLREAPLQAGGKTDISRVPGPLGFTDFAMGRIDSGISLGWSSVVNPSLKAAYICFYPGPAVQTEDDIILRFTDLWMQYGGRPFTPWAPYEGGTDLTYCLGSENAAAAYAQGLEYSRRIGKVLGAPATVTIPAKKKKTLHYGCLFETYEGQALDEGILALEAEQKNLVCRGARGNWKFNADPGFAVLGNLEKKILT